MEGISPQMLQIIITLIGSVLGSGAAVTLIKFFVERNDNKKKEEKQEQKEAEKDKLEEMRIEVNGKIDERERKSIERANSLKEDISSLAKVVDDLTKNISKNSETLNLVGEGMKGITHDKIIYLTDHFIRRQGITTKEMSTLKALYEPYRALGGNGDCEAGYNACVKLSIIDEDKAEELDIELRKKDLGLNEEK